MGEPHEYNRREFIHRIGTFFLLVSLGLIVFFLLSEAAGKPTFEYFCSGTVLAVIGFIFRTQYKKEVPSSGRFSILNRFRKGKE